MPLYVTPDDVILRMQLNSELAGVEDVVSSAIIGSQLHVESVLQGSFMEKAQNCVFFTDRNAFSGLQPGGVFRLELPSGFIRKDCPVTITYSRHWNMWEAQTVWPEFINIDHKRGYVLLDHRRCADRYIQVQCTTGFKGSVPTPCFTGTAASYSATTAYTPGQAVIVGSVTYVCIVATTGNAPPNGTYWTPVTYVPEQIPQELYEAILSYVPTIFDASQTTNRNQEAEPQYKKAADHTQILLFQYLRMKGFSFRPIINHE